jgi:hypothetical protein
LISQELEKLHADRIAAMKREAEKRAELERKGHGSYEEVTEGDFLEVGWRRRLGGGAWAARGPCGFTRVQAAPAVHGPGPPAASCRKPF